MEKKERIDQAIKNIKKMLSERKFGSKNNPVLFNKADFLTGAALARENNLDKDEVHSVLLNLYKTRVSIDVNSSRKLVTFIGKDLRTIYLHPMAKEVLIQNLSKQKD